MATGMMDQTKNPYEAFSAATGKVPLSLSLLSGSRTNTGYLVEVDGARYVMRIPGDGTNEYINRADECANLRAINELPFVPELVYSDASTGILITRYIESSRSMTLKDVESPVKVDVACGMLARLHESGLHFQGKLDLRDMKDRYHSVLVSEGYRVPSEVSNAAAPFERLLDMLSSEDQEGLVPCHGDPNLNNFLYTEDGAYLIDWEYSGMSDRYFDIANFVMTDRMDAEHERLLLDSYGRVSGEKLDRRRYLRFKAAIDYMWIYWHLIKLSRNQMVEYNTRSWKNRLRRASENFSAAMEVH